jgi:hypothetical protein
MTNRRHVTAEQFAALPLAERHELLRTRLTRRGVLRTAAATAIAGGGPLLLTSGADAATSAAATVKARWLAFGADPRRQMTIRWQTTQRVQNPRVRIGLDTAYGREIPAQVTPLTTALLTSRLVQHYAVAEVDGLQPGTTYHYQVVHDGPGRGSVVTDDATFTTAPAQGASPFTFTAFGDQDVGKTSAAMDALLASFRPSFHLLAGDLAYADSTGRGLATDRFEPSRWGQYLPQIDRVARTVPWMVALGNHEIEAVYSPHGYGGFESRFTMPANGPDGCPGTYSFVYGNVAVVSLDANEVTAEFPANVGYSDGRQVSWARLRLATLRQDPAVDFVVVVMHQCAYSTGAHGSDAGVRRDFVPLIDAAGADLVISGHNHSYERSDPIRGGRATRDAPSGSTVNPATDGTTYVVVGGGGATSTGFWGQPERNDLAPYTGPDAIPAPVQGATTEQVSWSRARYEGHCLLAVDVDPGSAGGPTMRLRAVDAQGRTIDTVTLRRGPRQPAPAADERASTLTTAVASGAGLAVVTGGAALAVRRLRSSRSG